MPDINKELFIHSSPSEVNIALVEDKALVEIHKDKTASGFAVGDIYLGRVRKIMPGLNAAFVNVGYEKDAFLHYLDLGPQVRSLMKFTRMAMSGKNNMPKLQRFELEHDIDKGGKISNVLAANYQVLVQVAKEPISTKGPRITSEISFAGRYLVLVPFSNKISVSQKIKSGDERNRLKRLIQSIKPNNFGVIIRTVAENKMVADLDNDLKTLVEKWENSVARLAHAQAPQKIIGELDRTSVILRDILSDSFNNIYVDSPVLLDDVKTYIRTIAPEKTGIVKLYKGKTPIFEFFGIDRQIKGSFGRIVTIRSGIYLIIDHTEAMHVIDVNSGHRTNKMDNQEANAIGVNIEAAVEIARQLRLRDMGGIIVIDFIDMRESHNRRKLFQKLRDEMARDRARHTILPPSKFGLVQITRQRVRPEMNLDIIEKCPACGGTGEIRPSILLLGEIENNLRYLIQEQNEKGLRLAVHPIVLGYLTKGFYSIRMKWFVKYRQWIRLRSVSSYNFLEYRFFNRNNDEIKM